MKLRCTTNSIRLRLRKSDLQQLSDTHKITDEICFPNEVKLTYMLTIHSDKTIEARFEQNKIVISLPKAEAMNWISSSAVSIESHLILQGNDKLHLLIEKDFPCKDREEENKEDTFWELSTNTNSC